jgi:uncharacterized protein YbjT (DUF2867 family)
MEVIKNNTNNCKALLLGASGLVGSFCLQELLSSGHYKMIYAPTRKKLELNSIRLNNPIINLNHLDNEHEMFKVNDVYCCLGTTIAKAKTKENFLKIDYHLVITLAHLAHRQGAKKLAFVSSLGASIRGNFYLKTKAEAELGLRELGYQSLHILRPSVLLGERNEKRTLEKLSIDILSKTGFLFKGFLSKYKPIHAKTVARFMVYYLNTKKDGVYVHESNQII